MSIWTHGRWTVKPGREEEFVASSRDLAPTMREEVGAPLPTLLRDRERPNVFLTFGRGESIEAIEDFRAAAIPRISQMQHLLEAFQAFTLDEVAMTASQD